MICKFCKKDFFSLTGKDKFCHSCKNEIIEIKKTIEKIQDIEKNKNRIALQQAAEIFIKKEKGARYKLLGINHCPDPDNCDNCPFIECILPIDKADRFLPWDKKFT